MKKDYKMTYKKGRKIIGKSVIINTTYFRKLVIKYHKENNVILKNQAYKRYLEMGGRLSMTKILSKG